MSFGCLLLVIASNTSSREVENRESQVSFGLANGLGGHEGVMSGVKRAIRQATESTVGDGLSQLLTRYIRCIFEGLFAYSV
eukprot:2648725-Pyramimonas_sp.AAC.1